MTRRRPNKKFRRANAPPVEPQKMRALEAVEGAVERAKKTTDSQQPRFSAANPQAVWSSTYRWVMDAQLNEPPYSPLSARRDQWLRAFWRVEPHLAGVVNSVIAIDKNRGWTLTGGRNQVGRFTQIFHGASSAPGLIGWRNFLSSQGLSFYCTDMGAVCELGTGGKGGPLRALYHVDSARCQLTGRPDTPLSYNAGSSPDALSMVGNMWDLTDFFRVVSLPSDDELMHGLGFCAVSRCLELAKLMVAVFRHDAEQLGSRMPEGLLLLQNISQDQWDDAMATREAQLDQKNRSKFGGVHVLATAGIDQVDAKLVALSNLPANFNMQQFTDQLLYGYALCFGYSAREFWPVSSGTLGTATEAQTQDDNSTGKGERDFSLNYQEQIQEQIPPALLFEFDERDAKGDLDLLKITKAKADLVQTMGQWQIGYRQYGIPVLTPAQLLQMAADEEVIPASWAINQENMVASDTNDKTFTRMRERYREHPAVVRAIAQFPSDPIVRYEYPADRLVTLWESGEEASRRRQFPTAAVGPSELDRLEGLIKRAIALVEAPPPAGQPQAPVVLVTGQDGALTLMPQPAGQSTVVLDTAELARVIERTAPDWDSIMRAVAAYIPAAPPIEPEALAAAVARAMPRPTQPEPMDYERLAAALAAAFSKIQFPPVAVNVSVPEPAAPQVVVQKAAESVTFRPHYDSQGRIDSIDKTPSR